MLIYAVITLEAAASADTILPYATFTPLLIRHAFIDVDAAMLLRHAADDAADDYADARHDYAATPLFMFRRCCHAIAATLLR